MRAARRFPARHLRCSRYLWLQGLHPMSPILKQIRNARLSRLYGGVKDRVEDLVVAFVLTSTWFIRIVTSHVRPEACRRLRYWKTLGRPNANVRAGREDQASKERNTAAALMCGLDGSGSCAPITLSQFTCEQLQRHIVTDPGCSRIVAGTFVAKKRVCGVELMPLEVRSGIT